MGVAAILSMVILLLSVYCGLDPFKHSAITEFPDFKAYKIEFPAWGLIPKPKDNDNLLQKSEIKFRNQVQGPESLAFDLLGRGPYTGVADGRIVFWDGKNWIDFAHTSMNRSEICNYNPSPSNYLKNEHICGRPLGLRFDKKTGDLYIADAYFGLMKVGPKGGLATQLATEAEGVPLRFTNDLDIDDYGNVYFTDSSTVYQRRNFMHLVFSAENSGRVLKYNSETGKTTVLVRNLQFPNGISLSKDGTFLIFCEGAMTRLIKYWLKGEKMGITEVLAILPGFPDNIRMNAEGDFWVAIHSRLSFYSYVCGLYPRLRTFLLMLPIPTKIQFFLNMGGRPHAMAVKYSPEGKLLQILEDREGKVVKAISEVDERDGQLWMGSVLVPSLAVYHLP